MHQLSIVWRTWRYRHKLAVTEHVASHFDNNQFGTCIVSRAVKAIVGSAPPTASVSWHLRDCGGLHVLVEREAGNTKLLGKPLGHRRFRNGEWDGAVTLSRAIWCSPTALKLYFWGYRFESWLRYRLFWLRFIVPSSFPTGMCPGSTIASPGTEEIVNHHEKCSVHCGLRPRPVVLNVTCILLDSFLLLPHLLYRQLLPNEQIR
jgi:hypothetical protein